MKDNEYRVKVSIRNNLILQAIEDAGFKTISAFCRYADMDEVAVRKLVSFKYAPIGSDGEFKHVAKKLMEVLGAAPSDLWTDEQLQLKLHASAGERCVSKVEINRLLAIGSNEQSVVANPEDAYLRIEESTKITEALNTLTPREVEVLDMHFGLSSGNTMTLEEIGNKLGVTRESARSIEANALRKLRHPDNSGKLKVFWGCE